MFSFYPNCSSCDGSREKFELEAQLSSQKGCIKQKAIAISSPVTIINNDLRRSDPAQLIGIENQFDTEYLDNLRINARKARYYEPGSVRRVYAGIEITWL